MLNSGLQSIRVSPDNVLALQTLAVLVQQESRHGANAYFGSRADQLVNVDLVEFDIRVFLAEFRDLGRDGLARAAPGGEAVDDDGVLGVDDLLRVFGVAGGLLVWFFGLWEWLESGKGIRTM